MSSPQLTSYSEGKDLILCDRDTQVSFFLCEYICQSNLAEKLCFQNQVQPVNVRLCAKYFSCLHKLFEISFTDPNKMKCFF